MIRWYGQCNVLLTWALFAGFRAYYSPLELPPDVDQQRALLRTRIAPPDTVLGDGSPEIGWPGYGVAGSGAGGTMWHDFDPPFVAQFHQCRRRSAVPMRDRHIGSARCILVLISIFWHLAALFLRPNWAH